MIPLHELPSRIHREYGVRAQRIQDRLMVGWVQIGIGCIYERMSSPVIIAL